MVSGSVSLLCSRCFSPFPHGTGSLSVSQEYLALADGAAGFRQDFSGPALLRILIRYKTRFTYGTITLYGPAFQLCSVTSLKSMSSVLQPPKCRNILGLGSFPFARHYLGNHYCFLLLCLLRCFSSAGSPPYITDNTSSWYWVAPFGNLRINAYLQLPEAYRSLSRPSSPLRA